MNIMAVTMVNNILFFKELLRPRDEKKARGRQRGNWESWKIAQRLDGEHKPSMRVRLHVQLEMSFRRDEAIPRRAG